LFSFSVKPELFTKDGKLVEQYFGPIDENRSSTIRFYLEQERRSKLNNISPLLNTDFFNLREMHTSLDFSDELFLGFHQSILDNAIFEVTINGVKQEYSGSGQYECPIAPKVLIDMKKISINPETQNLDTICISKLITRA